MFLFSDNGIVMTCGDGSFGALGHGDWNSSARPKLIEQLLRYHISAVRNHVSHNVFYRLLTNISDLGFPQHPLGQGPDASKLSNRKSILVS